MLRAQEFTLNPDYMKHQDERVHAHQDVIEELKCFLNAKKLKEALALQEAENKKLEEQLAEMEFAIEEAEIEAEIEVLREEIDSLYLGYAAWEKEIEGIKSDKASELKSIWQGLSELEEEIGISSLERCEKFAFVDAKRFEAPAAFVEEVVEENAKSIVLYKPLHEILNLTGNIFPLNTKSFKNDYLTSTFLAVIMEILAKFLKDGSCLVEREITSIFHSFANMFNDLGKEKEAAMAA
ncbi:MAG: hypothetical protein LW825_01370 [Candidatus Jidaibacter sp.]|jgi:hypothetical protein|nr:hypothetical protein [Candidatus Jidaibacter sp.]